MAAAAAAALIPFIPDIIQGIGSLFSDKGRGRRRSTRKGQVRKTARRAYVKKRKHRKRLPPRKKNGQFRKVRHRRKRRK